MSSIPEMVNIASFENVSVQFTIRKGLFSGTDTVLNAVDNVSLSITKGETLGLVGESGCGKTTLSRAILKLLPVNSGKVVIDNVDWTHLTQKQLRPLRRTVNMVFQNPYASLNPRMTVLDMLMEPLLFHLGLSRKSAVTRVVSLLEQVGIEPQFMRKFSHEFSGGQRQRIAIARAIATEPKLLIADEPVSSLDVSVQAQILNLLMKLRRTMGLSMLFVSHDLSVVRHICDSVAVMYLGRIVEWGLRDQVFFSPKHPYTMALLDSVPEINLKASEPKPLFVLPGEPSSPLSNYKGCRFRSRCKYAIDKCEIEEPLLERDSAGHSSACFRSGEL